MLLEVENLPLPEEESIDKNTPFLAADYHYYKGMDTKAENVFICCRNPSNQGLVDEYIAFRMGRTPHYISKEVFAPLPKSFRIILTQ